MLFLRHYFNNPWFIGIGTGVLATVIGSMILFYWQDYEVLQVKRVGLMSQMKVADTLPLNSAIGVYEHMIDETRSNDSLSDLLAQEEQTLGGLYLHKANEENTKDLDEKAIAVYTDTLSFYSTAHYPKERAESLMGIGNAYYDLRDTSTYLDNLHSAAYFYEKILSIPHMDRYPDVLGKVYNFLGVIYFEISWQEDMEVDRKKALLYYSDALRYVTEKNNPRLHWAITFNIVQIRLRIALVMFDPNGLQKGITDLTAMSKQFSLEEDEYHYLLCMLNIARAYSYLSIVQMSKDDGITADTFYEKVLTDYFKRTYPDIYPSAEEDNATNDEWIAEVSHDQSYYQKALVLLSDSMQFDLYKRSKFLTAQNLQEQGKIYVSLDSDPHHFSEALDLYNRALDEFDVHVYPNRYGLAMIDRGVLYLDLFKTDKRSLDNLDHAIEDFKSADMVALDQHYVQLHAQARAQLVEAYTYRYSSTGDKADAEHVVDSANIAIPLLQGTARDKVVPLLKELKNTALQELP